MRLCFVEETGSTNADLLADPSATEGDWLIALRQSSGKGRQGRQWQSLDGNFAGSTLIRLRDTDPPPATLALAAGLALIEAADAAAPGRALQLKWPNDLMLDNDLHEWAKLGGILLERSGDRVVAGFGVNLATAPAIDNRPIAHLERAVTPSLRSLARRQLGSRADLLARRGSRCVRRCLAAPRSPDRYANYRSQCPRPTPVGSISRSRPRRRASAQARRRPDRARPRRGRDPRQSPSGALGRHHAARDRCREH